MIKPVLPVYDRVEVDFERGEGVYLYDLNNKKYLDFATGIGVNSLGYSHPRLLNSFIQQAKKLWHISNRYSFKELNQVALLLTQASGLDTVFFCSSGAESVEVGIKVIRKYFSEKGLENKKRIITFKGSFHGRTIATISAGGNEKYKEGFSPLLDGFDQVDISGTNEEILQNIKNNITNDTAAILFEPILGEGGIRVIEPKLIEEIKKICVQEDILLFLDEVQCGAGRTGKFFCYQYTDIKPDILSSAKGIGGGFPVGVCLMTEEVGKSMSKGSHGGTYGGSPLALACVRIVAEEILSKGFLDNVIRQGKNLTIALSKLKDKYPHIISKLLGVGLMQGIALNKNYNCNIISKNLVDYQLLTIPSGNNVLRFLPPLIITDSEINECAEKLDRFFASL